MNELVLVEWPRLRADKLAVGDPFYWRPDAKYTRRIDLPCRETRSPRAMSGNDTAMHGLFSRLDILD